MEQTRAEPAATVPGGLPSRLTVETLYAAEYAPMVRVAFLLVGGAAAEEVVQDAFARVIERWDRLDRPGAYLRTCVVNGCRDRLRRRRVARLRQPRPREAAGDLGADHLLDALAVLSPARRAAVVLRYYADLPEAEIAEALGVKPGTVKSMLHRSLRQLREVVER